MINRFGAYAWPFRINCKRNAWINSIFNCIGAYASPFRVNSKRNALLYNVYESKLAVYLHLFWPGRCSKGGELAWKIYRRFIQYFRRYFWAFYICLFHLPFSFAFFHLPYPSRPNNSWKLLVILQIRSSPYLFLNLVLVCIAKLLRPLNIRFTLLFLFLLQ